MSNHKVFTSNQLNGKALKQARAKYLVATYKKGDITFHLVVADKDTKLDNI